jgi:cytosine/uracil/thiamine/allantoin permease
MRADPPRQRAAAVAKDDRKATFDRRKAVMEMFSDNAKTYIQLSGAALALTLTFAKSILHIPDTQSIVNGYTITMWACFLLAILFGAFYQFLSVKQIDAFLDWDYDETWDKAPPA